MSTAGAYLRLARAGETVSMIGCEEAYPELLDVSCDDVRLDAGSLLWVAGTRAGVDGARRWVLRLHTFDVQSAGYVLRYEAVDQGETWRGFTVTRAALTGYGWDAVIASVAIGGPDARRGYDLLTWRTGGPLTLRAHRRDVPNLRMRTSAGRLDEYEADSPAGPFVHRIVRWDGARFRLATAGSVPAARVPPRDAT